MKKLSLPTSKKRVDKIKSKVLGVIPARLKSTRLPEKLLLGIGGRPLLYYTWRRACAARLLDHVLIATDSKIIFDVCKNFGADVMMTSDQITCGSDRVAAATRRFKKFKPAIVVNIQGDEPLMPQAAIDATVRALLQDKKAVVATPITPFSSSSDVASPNFVKAISDREGYALYFSRSVLPYPREQVIKRYWKHLGLYAFRADFLQRYVKLPATPLEKAEKLEQLRILEHGCQIKLVPGNFQTMEVNTLEEFKRAREMIVKR